MEGEKKQLGMLNIFSLGLSGAIGSGIFVMLGMGIVMTGRSIVWVVSIGCVFMLFAYFYHVVMSSMFVFDGGEYRMKSLMFGPMMTGVSAIFSVIGSCSLAMYGLAVVDYASMVFPAMTDYKNIIAVAVITLMFLSTIKGSKFVANITTAMTFILIGAIALFVIVGFPQVKPGYFQGDDFFLGGSGGFVSAIAIMSFACQGTTMAPISMSAVTKNAKRTIPIAILFITVSLALIYGLMGFVAAGVLPVSEVAGQNLALVSSEIFPHWAWVVFILGGAVFAIATSALGGIAMLRYPLLKVAEDGWLPKFFTKKTETGYPWAIQGFFYMLSVLPIVFGFNLDAIVSLVMIPAMLICLYMNISLLKCVKKFPQQWKASVIHMPYPVLCLFCAIAAFCDIVVMYNLFVMLAPKDMVVIVAMLAACIVIAFWRIKSGSVDVKHLEEQKNKLINQTLNTTEN